MKTGLRWEDREGDDRDDDGSTPEIPAILEETWCRQLHWFFDLFNGIYLRHALRRPIFRIGTGTELLGQWNGTLRTITISARHILEQSWESVMDTLRHEMAHQFVDEFQRLPADDPHGDAFRDACRQLRVDPTPSVHRDKLSTLESSNAERDKILSRVKLLLALAKSPNENEAANAMRMANKYLLKYNIDLAQATSETRYEMRHLGRCSARIQEYEYSLANILQTHFFVRVIWTFSFDWKTNRRGRLLEVYGTPENLEMAEYVFHYVTNLASRLWDAHRRTERSRRGTKLQYLAGLLRGLQEKLDRQRVELKEEQGLVWVGDPQLKRYYRYMNPRVSSGSSSGVSRGERFHAGLRDGREITIHKGLGAQGKSRGRLLPG